MTENKSNLLIVQPWFTAIGHPAQSLLNTASVLGVDDRVSYLISREGGDNLFTGLAEQLGQYGRVETFVVPSSSIRTCTLLSLLALLRKRGGFTRLLFLDAHLVLLAFFWSWIAGFLKIEILSVIYLMGPEKISNNWLTRKVISSFLSRQDTRLFLRTEELADAWRTAFPGTRIDVLPSLELPEGAKMPGPPVQVGELRFGVLGQVRPGKGIEWLVPLFEEHPEVGVLTVAGAFITRQHEQALAVLRNYNHFINRFLPEQELVALAASQHYLLMLYDNWDARMEAATLYVAARANRPIIAREAGWCGRMVKTYNCGIICGKGSETADFFRFLPGPGDAAYLNLLSGLERFRMDHSGPAWRRQFIEKVIQN